MPLHPAQMETLVCLKLLVCSKVHHQQLHFVSAMDGGGRDTASPRSFRKSWARCSYPRNSLSDIKPLPTAHLFPWRKHNCCWLRLAVLQQLWVMSEQESVQFASLALPAWQGRGKDGIALRPPNIATRGALLIDVILQPRGTVIRTSGDHLIFHSQEKGDKALLWQFLVPLQKPDTIKLFQSNWCWTQAITH